MIKGVIFDFDLTLVDSAKGICGNLNAVAERLGLRKLDISEVRPTIGRALIDAMHGFWGDGPAETEWLPLYRRLFEERHFEGVDPFPETVPMFNTLRNAGIKTAIATNRLNPRVIVTCVGLAEYVESIVGIDNLTPKPDPAIVLKAASDIGCDGGGYVYVGDTDIDMKTAINAHAIGIGMLTGNHDAACLKEAGASYVLENLTQLPGLLARL